MATTLENTTRFAVPPNDRVVGIANYSSTFAVATEHGIWRYSSADGCMVQVPFAVPNVAPGTKLL